MRLLVCYSTLAPARAQKAAAWRGAVVIGTTRHLLSTAKFAAELWFAIVAANRLHTGCTLGCTLCFTLHAAQDAAFVGKGRVRSAHGSRQRIVRELSSHVTTSLHRWPPTHR